MPLPASLIASIVSAVIEAAAQSSTSVTQSYEVYVTTRTLPPQAKTGVMLPPTGDGRVTINGVTFLLATTAQFRNEQNLIVMPMTIQASKPIVYVADASGAIYRVWMLNPSEISALPTL
jgi:hypothetical protein